MGSLSSFVKYISNTQQFKDFADSHTKQEDNEEIIVK